MCAFHSGSDLLLHQLGFQIGSVKYESFVIHMDHQEHLGEGMPGSKWLWQRNLQSKEQGGELAASHHFSQCLGKAFALSPT